MLGDLVEGLIRNWGRIGLLEYTNVPYLHPLRALILLLIHGHTGSFFSKRSQSLKMLLFFCKIILSEGGMEVLTLFTRL